MKKRFKHDVTSVIKGMSFEDAKRYCLSENYVLCDINDTTDLSETYIITVTEYDDNRKILTSKYGK